MSTEQIQKITTKGIICREGQVLFAKDQGGLWELPGGRVNFGESPEAALKRELQEEVGFTQVEVGNIIHVWTFTSAKAHNTQFILLVFECFTNEKKVELSEEHLAYAWISLGETEKFSMRDEYRESIKKYQEFKNLDHERKTSHTN